ncbi:Hcp family type VI secretion system effector [Scandinavium sp. M-37]|uniref:Hcp family type VI secretion system effector n=1 Tax=Scandinavium sp. M-37 TaxID=3373077 RepID=UPI0037471836
MSIPAYMWLTDEKNTPIAGPCLMPTRLGSFEIKSFTHGIWIPADGNTGKLTGTRLHQPITFEKEFDRATPMLYRALCEGRILKSATIRLYHIVDAGMEVEYFNIMMENVKIVSINPLLAPTGNVSTHTEEIQMRYETITWLNVDGHIIYKDCWNERTTA